MKSDNLRLIEMIFGVDSREADKCREYETQIEIANREIDGLVEYANVIRGESDGNDLETPIESKHEEDELRAGWPGDGSGEDDLADYNANEANDYQNE